MTHYDNPRFDAAVRILTVVSIIVLATLAPTVILVLYGLPLAIFAVVWVFDVGWQFATGSQGFTDMWMLGFLMLPYTGLLYALTGEEEFLAYSGVA